VELIRVIGGGKVRYIGCLGVDFDYHGVGVGGID
jgi:hypothetical protein